jgi:succinate dehydrogenase/fumarate reductase flavoprotein subunit
MQVENNKCDVLCVGGGIAGLMAAIQACESGAKVIVAEKANTLRSGMGGMGNDHFQCYIPEAHGSFDDFWKGLFYGQWGDRLRKMDREYVRYWYENTFDIVNLWEKWGIPMKYEGKYEFAGHGFPGKQLNHLKYSGANQKQVLTARALDSGAKIMNRVMIYDLLKNREGQVRGATGISTREDKLIVFEAGSVILSTGSLQGMYPSSVPAAHNNRGGPITVCGDGRAMAYRSGAELKDLELVQRHAGPKYLTRAGQGSWVGVLRDPGGKAIGPYLAKPDRRYHDMTIEVNKSIFTDYKKAGKGPIYMDLNGISREDLDYMIHWFKNEGLTTVVDYLEEQKVDLMKAAIEFQTSELMVAGGIFANFKGETSVGGLYAAGDEVEGSISHAAVFGKSAGAAAAGQAAAAGDRDIENKNGRIEAEKARLEAIRNRKDGARWQEAQYGLQQVMNDYCGEIRSENWLVAGLDVMKKLKKKADDTLMAGNAHELMFCLQALNQIEIGELLLFSANDRKESRGLHSRADHTLTDPLLSDKLHVVKKAGDKPVTGWVEIKW